MRTSGTRTTLRGAALLLVVAALALGALSGASASAAPGAEGAAAHSAGAGGSTAERARAGPSRLWYKLIIDYRGRQLVTRKSRPTDKANQGERVDPAAKLTVEEGFSSAFTFLPETAVLLRRQANGAFSILADRPLNGFKSGPYLTAQRSNAPGCTPYTQRWFVKEAADLTTSIGAKPSGNGFTRVTIRGRPPHLPTVDLTSSLEEDAWQCNWTEQDAADGDGDGLPTFAYRWDFGGHQLTPPGEKPILFGDDKDVYPAKRLPGQPVRPRQLFTNDWYDTFAEIDLAPVRFGKSSFKRGVDIEREGKRQHDRGWFVVEITTRVEEHWDFEFIRCSKPTSTPC
jgi:hypothetical protein